MNTEAKVITRVLSFFGPPGTGKGTVAKRCVTDLGYIMLSTGDLSRKHIQEGSDLGRTFQSFVNKGHLIPDDLITQMVLAWLEEHIAPGKTIILDGFPRTKGQADLLMQALKNEKVFDGVLFKVLNFDLDATEIINRISARLTCSNKSCQEVYSTLVKIPAQKDICDLCGSGLIRRTDDEAKVVRERLAMFAKYRDALLSFYKEAGQEVIDFDVPEGDPKAVYSAFTKIL